MAVAESTCSFDGCDRAVRARGLCAAHHTQYIRKGVLKPLRITLATLDDRIDSRIAKSDGCWAWDGAHAANGYAVVNVGAHRTQLVHRLMYARINGDVPDGLVIDHKCHNRGCVNPSHLHAVTTKQNNENRSGAQLASTSGIRGVSFHAGRQRWRARLQHNRREYFVGYFDSAKDAERAVSAARARIFTNSQMDLVRSDEP